MSRVNWDYGKVLSFVKENSTCSLLSSTYINGRTKLVFECGCGGVFEASFEKFRHRNKRTCNECSFKRRRENRRYGYSYIKDFINSKDCVLLSDEYKNSKTHLDILCSCGISFKTTFDRFRSGKQYCDLCGRNKMGLKMTMSDYKQRLSGLGLPVTVVSTEYVNGKTPLKFLCVCGEVFKRQPRAVVEQGQILCLNCSNESRKISHTKAHKEFNNEVKKLVGIEYTVLSEYTGAHDKIKFSHNSSKCGNNKFEMTSTSFLMGTRCPECARLNQSGKNNWRYNPDITDEERELRRYYLNGDSQEKWRKEVFKRDDYICQCCGVRGSCLNAHHLNSWDWDIEGRFDIDNGATLCVACHLMFHKQYGYGNNTKEQYEDFIQHQLITP